MKMIADKLEPIRAFEKQSGLARLLLFLYLEGQGNMSWMIDGSNIYPKSDRIVFQTIWQMNLAHQRSTVQSVSPLKSESKLRRVGNSLAVIVPNGIIEEKGLKPGGICYSFYRTARIREEGSTEENGWYRRHRDKGVQT